VAEAGPVPISGCVICYQEADRITDCVRSLASFCDEIVVVDSGSTDGTQDLARQLGARIIENRPFPGYREQRQWAVAQTRFDQVFCLDADERCTEALQRRVQQLRQRPMAVAYEMPRQNHYLGRILRHGLFVPDRKLRLFDRRFVRFVGRNPHDRIEVVPGQVCERLPEAIEHLSYRDFRHHLRTIDRFTAVAARELAAAGRRTNPFDLLVRPPAVFVKSYLLKLGLLDGWRGIVVAVMAAYTDWLKYWRLFRQPRRPEGV